MNSPVGHRHNSQHFINNVNIETETALSYCLFLFNPRTPALKFIKHKTEISKSERVQNPSFPAPVVVNTETTPAVLTKKHYAHLTGSSKIYGHNTSVLSDSKHSLAMETWFNEGKRRRCQLQTPFFSRGAIN